jgi:Tfp pilus assembly PilM family ATPase
MSGLDFMKSPWLYVEIGQSSLKVLNGGGGLDFPLDRQENGRLTRLCREQLTRSLHGFLKRKRWQPRMRALCAIGARGVSLRRLTLPSATNEEFQRLLRLQIESEFPLPPDQLAWGYRRVKREDGLPNGPNSRQELIVVAVKKELIEEYSDIFSDCGVNPVFTLTAFTRSRICPQPSGTYAVLDVGHTHSEWMSFENGAPNSLRVLPWGRDNVTRAIEQRLGISHGEAEQLKINLVPHNTLDEDTGQKLQNAVETELDSLAESLRSAWTGQKIYLTGKSARDLDLAPRLVKRLGDGMACEYSETVPGQDRSAAILGLETPGSPGVEPAPLLIQVNDAQSAETLSRPAPWKWAALAVLLAIGLVSLPYAETLLMKSRLSRKLATLNVEKQRLPEIDRELRFLQFLKDNQPPYLEALAIVANAAQPGTRFDSVAMNRRGDLSLRGFMRDSQQVVDFRSKLIKSGFFSTVVVEEQNPTPDRQKVILRISAQWKTTPGRESLPMAPAAAAIEKPTTGGKEMKSNPPPEKVVSNSLTSSPVTPGSVTPGPATLVTNPPPKP